MTCLRTTTPAPPLATGVDCCPGPSDRSSLPELKPTIRTDLAWDAQSVLREPDLNKGDAVTLVIIILVVLVLILALRGSW